MAGLALQGVTKTFGSVDVIKGIDLAVEDGEFVVFVGPSGCGKSTLLRLIAGLEGVTDGRIVIGGRDVADASPADRGIAMVFQSYALYPHMTVRENLSFGLENTRTPKAEIQARVLEAARMLEIEPFLDRRPRALSGGQRQRVAIGRAIVRHPEVFLFDEPLSNLDAALRVQTRAEITKLHRRLGATMIYVTHDQVEAMTMADRIAVLNGGRLEQFGRPLELFESPVNRFVAGFIGSPRMNVYPGRVTALAGDRASVVVPGFGPLAFTVDPALAAGAEAIELGIRPAHFAVGAAAVAAQPSSTPVADFVVDYAESIGTETFVYGTVAGSDVATVLHVPDHLEAREGERLPVAPLVARAHLFRADDGRSLAARPAT